MDRWIDFQKKGFLSEERSWRGRREISRNDWPGEAPRTPARRGPAQTPGPVSSVCPWPIPAYALPALAERTVCPPSMVRQAARRIVFVLPVSWGPEDLSAYPQGALSEQVEPPGRWRNVIKLRKSSKLWAIIKFRY